MKKIVSAVIMMSAFTASAPTFAMGEDIAKEAIKATADVAKAAINKNKSEVNVKNSTLDNGVVMNKAINVGNSGISAKADKVNIKNSKIKNRVVLNKAINVGNSGVQLGQ